MEIIKKFLNSRGMNFWKSFLTAGITDIKAKFKRELQNSKEGVWLHDLMVHDSKN